MTPTNQARAIPASPRREVAFSNANSSQATGFVAASAVDRAGASTGRSISGNVMSEGHSSRIKLAAGSKGSAALFGETA